MARTTASVFPVRWWRANCRRPNRNCKRFQNVASLWPLRPLAGNYRMCVIALSDKNLMYMCTRYGCLRHQRLGKALLILILGVFVGLLLTGCGNSGAAAPEGAEKGGGGGGGKGGGRRGAGGDVPVTVAMAATKDVPVEVQVIGNVEAYTTISVR